MEYFLERLQRELSGQVQQLLGTTVLPVVQFANPKFDADMVIPCFAAAKEKCQDPQALAAQVAGQLTHAAVERAEAIAGFIAIWLKAEALAECLASDVLSAEDTQLQFGEHLEGKGKCIIVEFPSPNVAKHFDVGHLRAANQGWAVYELMRATGHTVIRDSHLGDRGIPFGKWAVGFMRFSSDERLGREGVYELARVYLKMTADLKFEAEHGAHELADEVQEWVRKLEQGDQEAVALSKRFMRLSLDHIHKMQARLHIETDEELGESFYIADAKKMVAKLEQKGIALRQAGGSIIVPLDEYGINTPALLQKNNGGVLYASTDMAAVKYRWERWRPSCIIYVVSAEQQFHFKQVFALVHKLGYRKPDYVHLSFGMINQRNGDGTRSKMSARKGVVLLEELLNKAEARARGIAAESNTDVSGEDISKIALGAIKFNDFTADRRTDILFDWDTMFSLQGFSGTYVQYAGVRMNSILRKFARPGAIPFDGTYEWKAEKEILVHLHAYPQVIQTAARELEPHRVAQFVYELCRILNRYYEHISIADSPRHIQQQRLWLLHQVKRIHAHALALLGIEVPAKM